ncbi:MULTISPECIES: DUF1176 domain-containing protein [Acinetobacter]|uniref:DUF1176 domain-containing protein n=1 Tax=Acinetobacter entericus TaxID=2989714 RepID=A0ABT3NDG9_9GAMM|nr:MULTISPECIES: DUF1176 domain-containing protein [Acinetobacter]MCW8037602.1 DUF1176 domain-containing protein [Acinetobacter entericus]TCB75829.1 DUF1176 domain-containing protein [Acinetobacter sp. ANC 4177]
MMIRHKPLPLHVALSFAFFSLYSVSQLSAAETISGTHFLYKDWELACDNTGTCRAAGYQADDHLERPVSVLLQRAAGANAPLTAWVKIDPEQLPARGKRLAVHMLGRSYGTVAIHEQTGEGKLSAVQTAALLQAVQSAASIIWTAEQTEWALSPAGASAVLLKMDTVQKRLGTPSALTRKGNQPNSAVLKPQALPLILIKNYRRGIAKHLDVNAAEAQKLVQEFRKSVNKDSCWTLYEQNYLPEDQITIYPLNRQNVVVEAPCWRGAYNYGYGYWVMDSALQQTRQLVTVSGSSFSEGQIFAVQKGRGLADCGSQEEWAWNGSRFVQTYKAIQAQCKGFAGSAWQMPVFISKVQAAQ